MVKEADTEVSAISHPNKISHGYVINIGELLTLCSIKRRGVFGRIINTIRGTYIGGEPGTCPSCETGLEKTTWEHHTNEGMVCIAVEKCSNCGEPVGISGV